MKRTKGFLGIFLIAAALVSMILWETAGREKLLCEEVLVAKNTIEKGAVFSGELIETVRIPKDNLVEHQLIPLEKNQFIGRRFKQEIPRNAQISSDFFYEGESILEEGKSIFVIKEPWIFAMSGSIRSGDFVELYYNGGAEKVAGCFQVAFVKDNAGREVVNVEGISGDQPLERRDGTSAPASIEILAGKREYDSILSVALSGDTFLIVQKEEASIEGI